MDRIAEKIAWLVWDAFMLSLRVMMHRALVFFKILAQDDFLVSKLPIMTRKVTQGSSRPQKGHGVDLRGLIVCSAQLLSMYCRSKDVSQAADDMAMVS